MFPSGVKMRQLALLTQRGFYMAYAKHSHGHLPRCVCNVLYQRSLRLIHANGTRLKPWFNYRTVNKSYFTS